ncbi:PepSY domain-containing protein [Bacillus sp. JJ1474]|uniref:PepSY domain-containing protein n=1 Tax=Bacillus sp. JJ1474 TaxID=3122955 RepID=UPI002FFFFF64
MKNKRSLFVMMGIAAIVILFIAFKALGPVINPSAEILSKSEVKTLVEERYNGQITEIILKNNQYVIEMDRNEMNYEIKLDAENGEVISFTKKSNIASNKANPEQAEPKPLAKPLTENEIKEKILSEFPGELVQFIKINEQGKSQYKVIVQGKGKKTILKVDAQTGEILLQKSETEATVIITEDEAIQIALKEVKGQINDVDLESDDNIHYYLIEIDTSYDREATVQIHGITGEVLSITWDD